MSKKVRGHSFLAFFRFLAFEGGPGGLWEAFGLHSKAFGDHLGLGTGGGGPVGGPTRDAQ